MPPHPKYIAALYTCRKFKFKFATSCAPYSTFSQSFMVFVGISKLGHTDFTFDDLG